MFIIVLSRQFFARMSEDGWKFWIWPTWFSTCFEQCKCEQESIVSLIKSYINGQFLISESLVFSEDLHKFAVLNQSVILPSCRSQKRSKIFNVKHSLFMFRLNARVSWRAVWYGKPTVNSLFGGQCGDLELVSSLCTYQCKPRGGGVRARGGDLTNFKIFWSNPQGGKRKVNQKCQRSPHPRGKI